MDRYGYTTEYLEALPTLTVGQDADLKVDENGTRVWLSRLTSEDGAPHDHGVEVEQHVFEYNPVSGAWDRPWRTVARYCGDRLYRLVDTWNGGTEVARTVWEGCHPDGAFEWVHDHTPFSHSEAINRQGYRLYIIR